MRIFAKGHKLVQIDRSHCPSIPCKPSVSASAAAGIAARSHKAHRRQYCHASDRTLESAWSHAETAGPISSQACRESRCHAWPSTLRHLLDTSEHRLLPAGSNQSLILLTREPHVAGCKDSCHVIPGVQYNLSESV